MTQEDKDLLLRDLCARLPYGVICKTSKGNGHLCSIDQTIFGIEYGINIKSTERDYFNDKEEIIKPYLRPMSSMTKEEEDELCELCTLSDCNINADWECCGVEIIQSHPRYGTYFSTDYSVIDWLNKNMFDYRGLILKDLAISTEVFNPYKD